jgi:chloramphenicol O-acetyltransferase type A
VRAFDASVGPRANAYAFYSEAVKPRWGLTTRVDVAPLLQALPAWREAAPGLTAFVAYHYAILRAAVTVPALCQRLLPEGGAVQWKVLDATPTVLRADDSFAVARLVWAERLQDFAAPALEAVRAAQQLDAPWGIRTEQSGELHMTTLPLVAFSHFTHARPAVFDDATPSLACGRFSPDGDRVWMPLNIEVHHALVDGVHVGRFVQALEGLLAEPQRLW